MYCYASPMSSLTPSFENLEYLFRKTKDEAEPFEVFVLGGEPFVRKDIVAVFESAQATFDIPKVGTSTNGTLISRLTQDELSRIKNLSFQGFSIQVSLDSVDPKVNDATRGKTKDTLAGMDTLERAEIPFIVGMCLTRYNQGDVVESITHLLDDYGSMKHINLEPIQPSAALGREYYDLRLEGDSMRDIYSRVESAVKDSGRWDVTISGVVDKCENLKEGTDPLINTYGFKACLAGLTRSAVFPDGVVSPCTTIRDVSLGNLYTESWDEIWTRARDRYEKLTIVGGQCREIAKEKYGDVGMSGLLRGSETSKEPAMKVRN
jgi:MoaA/NifB/PqqE/SkfB family radical SAM enzyme